MSSTLILKLKSIASTFHSMLSFPIVLVVLIFSLFSLPPSSLREESSKTQRLLSHLKNREMFVKKDGYFRKHDQWLGVNITKLESQENILNFKVDVQLLAPPPSGRSPLKIYGTWIIPDSWSWVEGSFGMNGLNGLNNNGSSLSKLVSSEISWSLPSIGDSVSTTIRIQPNLFNSASGKENSNSIKFYAYVYSGNPEEGEEEARSGGIRIGQAGISLLSPAVSSSGL